MTKICCVSDTHGLLPDLKSYNADLIIHAGDICPYNDHTLDFQLLWLNTNFKRWAYEQNSQIIGTWGNHDFIGMELANNNFDLKGQQWYPQLKIGANRLIYDRTNNLKIWVSAWSLPFFHWAFMATEEELEKIYSKIPHDVDIIVSHGPPYGYGDIAPPFWNHVGSHSLLNTTKKLQPKLVVCGHLHSGYGEYSIGNTKVVNCSLLDERYKLTKKPVLIEV